ncbi:MAG: RICIN domain-containing protein [Eggerthellaceae bacterium]|nr:RICIN domain-containing protein [Eggerthellaceae bacterium]
MKRTTCFTWTNVMALVFAVVIGAVLAAAFVPAPAYASDPSTTSAPSLTTSKAGDRTPEAGYYLEDGVVYRISTALTKKDTMVLDVAGGSKSAGANVQLYKANNTLAQYWRAVYKGNGVYQFVNLKNSNKLGVPGQLKNESNVSMQSSKNIGWKIVKNSNGSYSLIPAQNSKMRLDVTGALTGNGTNIQIYETNNTEAQKFYFVKQAGLTAAYKQGKTLAADIYEIAPLDNNKLRIDIQGQTGAARANVQLENKSKSATQKFQLSYKGNGLYQFTDIGSAKVLDVAGGSKAAGANIWQYKSNSTIAQFFYIKPSGNGYQIVSALSNLAFEAKGGTSAGANIQLQAQANVQTQKFAFTKSQLIDDGTYVISSALASPMVLDVAGGSKANKANLQIYRSNGTDAQKFKIKHVGNGIYTISSALSSKCVDVAGGSKNNGANAWLYNSNGTDAQKWRIELDSNGIKFKSVLSGKYLDVAGANIKRGTNVHLYEGNGSKAQSWVLHNANWQFYPKSTNVNDFKVIAKAEQYEGWPYYWGGRSPSTSFDCAGLVMYCSNAVWGTNFDLMYTNADRLLNDTSYNHGRVKRISASEAKVGDLVFYKGTYNHIDYISHVVFYVGRGYMYGAGDPIGYDRVNAIKNMDGKQAEQIYARITH